jgi:hypothetical protein
LKTLFRAVSFISRSAILEIQPGRLSCGVFVIVAIIELRRFCHRCHKIRGSSKGIDTPSQRGITRAV